MKKVAVLNCWGKMRAWGCHMVHHALYQKQNYSYAGVIEALSGAEKTDGGKLLFAPAELSGAVNTQYLVGLTDQKNSTVRVCDLTGASISVADSIWSYKYEYYNIADTRLREYNGREVVLAAYGGNSASMVSFDDKKEVLWRTDSTASNPHACELIPCGVIAVAASNGGEVRFFDAAGAYGL